MENFILLTFKGEHVSYSQSIGINLNEIVTFNLYKGEDTSTLTILYKNKEYQQFKDENAKIVYDLLIKYADLKDPIVLPNRII